MKKSRKAEEVSSRRSRRRRALRLLSPRDLSRTTKDHIMRLQSKLYRQKCTRHLQRRWSSTSRIQSKVRLRKLMWNMPRPSSKRHTCMLRRTTCGMFRCIIENRIDEEFRLAQDRLNVPYLNFSSLSQGKSKTDDAISKMLKIRQRTCVPGRVD